jgi:transketolase
MPSPFSPLDRLCVDTIRALSIDAIREANSGHPGLPLGAAPMAWALWSRHLKHSPAHADWPDRDRFVLSAGHGSMLLYSLLHLTGYDLSLDELKRFRQWDSRTPGHPERGVAPGVEMTTGPLGQGFAASVGMAMAERMLAARFNRPGHELVDHRTYTLVGDGCLMEGVAMEAASLAGHLRLGKLICLYDSNRISLAASTQLSFTQDVARSFEAMGWQVLTVEDGNDLAAISGAIAEAKAESRRPSILIVRTQIGYGSPKQGTFGVHGSPLNAEQVLETKKRIGYPSTDPFFIPEDALSRFREAVADGRVAEAEWRGRLRAYASAFPDLAAEWERVMARELPEGWDADLPRFEPGDKPVATRAAGGKVLGALAARVPEIVGGSADLNPSTETALKGGGDFQSPDAAAEDRQGAVGGEWGWGGRNLHFGVREHAMAAAASGLALHGGLRPFTATFLSFADYMRPSIRLAALMELPVVYVFTHDSIGVGEDGPTHQPVEQAASLRAIPNLTVIRPADANETAQAWRLAMTWKRGPVALLLTRQAVPVLPDKPDAAARGAYIVVDCEGTPDILLIASGSEVSVAIDAQMVLAQKGLRARVVSMPSWELFEVQTEEYRDSVLPPEALVRLAVEAGVSQGWHRYVGPFGDVIGIDGRFGASAPLKVVMEKYGFTGAQVAERAAALIERFPHRAKAVAQALAEGQRR